MEGIFNRNKVTAFLFVAIITGSVFATTYLAQQQQDNREHAAELTSIHEASTPPKIDITSPQNGEHITANSSVTVALLNDSAVEGIEIYIDNKQVTLLSAQPFTYSLSTLTPGQHSLTARAYDSLSRVSEKTITITK